MQPFTFSYGPRVSPPRPARPSFPTCCPTGPCLFVTDEQLIDARPRRALDRRAGDDRTRSPCSTRSRPIRRRRPCSPRSRRGARPESTSVVGFGGGSPMDVAKLAAYLLGSGDELDDDLGRRGGARARSCRWCWSRPPPAPDRRRLRSRSSPSRAGPSWRSMRGP